MADSTSIIDEEGNLFGVVNIIDALVVLLVLAVVVAGVALVAGGGNNSDTTGGIGTTYVTLDLGEQPNYITSAINEGDTYSPSGNSNLTITDIHLAPSGDRTRAVVRAELEAPATGNGIEYLNAQPRLGRQLGISTAQYNASGTVVGIGETETLDGESRTVVIRDTMAASGARDVTAGDEIRLGERRVATVEGVAIYPTGNANQYSVFTEVDLETYSQQGDAYFGDTPVRRGQSVSLPADEYTIGGSLEQVGAGLDRGDTTVVIQDTLSERSASEVSAGDEIALGGQTAATIEDVAVYPTSDASQHTVFVEAALDTYRQQGDAYFGDTQVRREQNVTLPAEDYTIGGTIQRVDGGLEQNSTDVLVQTTVDTETALSIAEGDVSTVAGYETAAVETVTTYATQDPDRTRVFVGLSLQTVGFGSDRRFSGTTLEEGNNVSFRTEEYQLTGPIQRVGSLEQRGTPANQTVTLELSDVDEETAGAFVPGMTERSGGEPVATVTDVAVEPEVIITTGDDGSVNVVDHPYLREVTLTTELRVRETTAGVRFKGETIQQGSTVVLNFGTMTVEADVVTVGA
jgi:hypothetical protein